MWYPSQEQLQRQSWYKYVQYTSTQQLQQQQIYSRTYVDDELSSACINYSNSENDSLNYCRSTYTENNHVSAQSGTNAFTSNKFYANEMSSFEKPSWNSVRSTTTKSSSSSSTCWNWSLFSPEYYSDSINFDVDSDKTEFDVNFLTCLPTCLLALLYITPKIISSTTNENEHDHELNSFHQQLFIPNQIEHNDQQIKSNRSSTPDTDDGYQSASDASRSDCSQTSSSKLSTPKRLSYAAAAKPIHTPIEKPNKQNLHTNDPGNLNGQKIKFIAPRFERMHHAKQHSSNRTQLRSNHQTQRNPHPPTTTTNNNNNNLTRRR